MEWARDTSGYERVEIDDDFARTLQERFVEAASSFSQHACGVTSFFSVRGSGGQADNRQPNGRDSVSSADGIAMSRKDLIGPDNPVDSFYQTSMNQPCDRRVNNGR